MSVSTLRGEALKEAMLEFDVSTLTPVQESSDQTEFVGQDLLKSFSIHGNKLFFYREADNYFAAHKTFKVR